MHSVFFLITTNDDKVVRQSKIYQNQDGSKQCQHEVSGYNNILEELQVVILRIKLKHIDSHNQNRLRVPDIVIVWSESALSKNMSCTVYYPVHLQQQKIIYPKPLLVTEDISIHCLLFLVFEMTEKIESMCHAILKN